MKVKKRVFKIIAAALIQAFLVLDFAWCGGSELMAKDEKDFSSTLAPEITLDKNFIRDIFFKETDAKTGMTRSGFFDLFRRKNNPRDLSDSSSLVNEGGKGITRREFFKITAIIAAIFGFGYGVLSKFSKTGELEFTDEASMVSYLSELVEKTEWETGGYYYQENGKWILVITDVGRGTVLPKYDPKKALGIWHVHGIERIRELELGRKLFPTVTDLAAIPGIEKKEEGEGIKEEIIALDAGKVVKLKFLPQVNNKQHIESFMNIYHKVKNFSSDKEDFLNEFESLLQEEFILPLYYNSNKSKEIFPEGVEPSYNEQTWIKIANILGLEVKFLLGKDNFSLPLMNETVKSLDLASLILIEQAI